MSDHDLEAAAQVRDGALFSPGLVAQIDALRASVHEHLRQRGIDAASTECEHAMVVAGGVAGQLRASPDTTGRTTSRPLVPYTRWHSRSCAR
jgi:hypothetical protein